MSGSYNISKPLAYYGAALSTTMLATGVDAAVVELTAIPDTVSASASTQVDVSGALNFAFDFVNTSFFGRNIYGLSTNSTGAYFGVVASSINVIDSNVAAGFTTSLYLASFGFAGKLFVGFETFLGNLGYIEFDFIGNGDVNIVSIFGSDTPGEAVNKNGDTNPVPLPGSLPLMAGGMLALGAAGLRKRRKQRAAAA